MSEDTPPAHLKKLCVGVNSYAEFAEYMLQRHEAFVSAKSNEEPWYEISTRNTPKKADQILNGGSLYWVINKFISARNRVLNFNSTTLESGKPICYIRLSTKLVPVSPRPHRPFQGWRYLEDAEKPQDIASEANFGTQTSQQLPENLMNELRKLGLI